MSERVVSSTEDIKPHIKNVAHTVAYRTLSNRHDPNVFDWYVTHPRSITTHRLGYERDEVTPSNHAAVVTRRLRNEDGDWIARGAVVAHKSLLVPAERTRAGVNAFVQQKMNGEEVEAEQFGFVLVSEPGTLFRRASTERHLTLPTRETGLTLAARALHVLLDASSEMVPIDPREAEEIRVVHNKVQIQLGIGRLLKPSRARFRASER